MMIINFVIIILILFPRINYPRVINYPRIINNPRNITICVLIISYAIKRHLREGALLEVT
jgi:hypothetical protein